MAIETSTSEAEIDIVIGRVDIIDDTDSLAAARNGLAGYINGLDIASTALHNLVTGDATGVDTGESALYHGADEAVGVYIPAYLEARFTTDPEGITSDGKLLIPPFLWRVRKNWGVDHEVQRAKEGAAAKPRFHTWTDIDRSGNEHLDEVAEFFVAADIALGRVRFDRLMVEVKEGLAFTALLDPDGDQQPVKAKLFGGPALPKV